MQRLRDVMLRNSADPVVDANCRENGLVLITHNYKHFRGIAHKLRLEGVPLKPVSRIDMECHQSEAVSRLRGTMHLVEAEWKRRAGAGMRTSICKATVRIHDD